MDGIGRNRALPTLKGLCSITMDDIGSYILVRVYLFRNIDGIGPYILLRVRF